MCRWNCQLPLEKRDAGESEIESLGAETVDSFSTSVSTPGGLQYAEHNERE